ncbi:MAG: winged helix-turn-helix domain-containing protein [Bacteroidaceae bacterium]|nr:winged helix-turn-helix domain-containing protein [Bacteroidaceae bacterium]
MMFEKAGELAGAIWNALNENGALNAKDLKKAAKAKSEKDLYLGLGWLLREDKLNVSDDEKEPVFSLK